MKTDELTLEQLKELRDLLDKKITEKEDLNSSGFAWPLKQVPITAPYTIPIQPFIVPQPQVKFEQYELCAIQEYFKQHPNETSVNMVCFCKFCTPTV